jgi:hypothetical protein
MAIKNRTALKLEKNTNYNDNTTGDVTPGRVRSQQESLIDSIFLREDYALISVSASASMVLDFNNQVSPSFVVTGSINQASEFTFVNTQFATKFTLMFTMGGIYAITFPANVTKSDGRFSGQVWTNLDTGDYNSFADFDGTNFRLQISLSPFV